MVCVVSECSRHYRRPGVCEMSNGCSGAGRRPDRIVMTIQFPKSKEKIMALVQVRPAVLAAVAAAVLGCLALPASAAHASVGGGSHLVGCSSWSAQALIIDANDNPAFVQYEVCDYVNNFNSVNAYN